MARALVVFESMFGNTRAVAEAVDAGLTEGRQVDVVEVGEAPDVLPEDVDARGRRADARVQPEPGVHPQVRRRPGDR
ncbi:hypothetical protein [Saccharothrix sp. NRRL B-16348]|uniref:hypothetical protein n=1 Tax=Saccharothrix sp. NRRL B-16348 TaxID=1415542 RepID=UPI000A990966